MCRGSGPRFGHGHPYEGTKDRTPTADPPIATATGPHRDPATTTKSPTRAATSDKRPPTNAIRSEMTHSQRNLPRQVSDGADDVFFPLSYFQR